MLFISDMDGTLLHPSGQVGEKTIEILSALLARGLHFTVATARTPLSALPLLQRLPLSDPMILMNGALCYDPASKQFSNPVAFARHSMEVLARAEKASAVEGMLFALDGGRLMIHMGSVKEHMWRGYFQMEQLSDVSAIEQNIHRNSAAELKDADVVYGLYMDDQPDRMDILYDSLKDSGLTVDYYKDKYTERRWCLEICSADATKGAALRKWKMERESYFIGFGDSWNDIPLFRECDEAYAVANASAELKKLANAVILSNAEDGVAQYIKERWETKAMSGRRNG